MGAGKGEAFQMEGAIYAKTEKCITVLCMQKMTNSVAFLKHKVCVSVCKVIEHEAAGLYIQH